jgi:hypothetical protein
MIHVIITCDSIQNINVFGYRRWLKAAAYALEFLGQQDDLKAWLYPSTNTQRLNPRSYQPQKEYNSINEYFGFTLL